MASSTAIPIVMAPTTIVPRSSDMPSSDTMPPVIRIGTTLGTSAINPYFTDRNRKKKLRPMTPRAMVKERNNPSLMYRSWEFSITMGPVISTARSGKSLSIVSLMVASKAVILLASMLIVGTVIRMYRSSKSFRSDKSSSGPEFSYNNNNCAVISTESGSVKCFGSSFETAWRICLRKSSKEAISPVCSRLFR